MKNIISRMDDSMIIGWKVLSYLSLSSNEQQKLIGQCDHNFFGDKKGKLGANYLFGVLLMANQYVINNFSEELFPDTMQVNELKSYIDILLYEKKDSTISIKDLESSNEWKRIRKLSSILLKKLKLYPIKLERPFKIENHIEAGFYKK